MAGVQDDMFSMYASDLPDSVEELLPSSQPVPEVVNAGPRPLTRRILVFTGVFMLVAAVAMLASRSGSGQDSAGSSGLMQKYDSPCAPVSVPAPTPAPRVPMMYVYQPPKATPSVPKTAVLGAQNDPRMIRAPTCTLSQAAAVGDTLIEANFAGLSTGDWILVGNEIASGERRRITRFVGPTTFQIDIPLFHAHSDQTHCERYDKPYPDAATQQPLPGGTIAPTPIWPTSFPTAPTLTPLPQTTPLPTPPPTTTPPTAATSTPPTAATSTPLAPTAAPNTTRAPTVTPALPTTTPLPPTAAPNTTRAPTLTPALPTTTPPPAPTAAPNTTRAPVTVTQTFTVVPVTTVRPVTTKAPVTVTQTFTQTVVPVTTVRPVTTQAENVFATNASTACPTGYVPIDDISTCKLGLVVGGSNYTWNLDSTRQTALCYSHYWPGSGCFAYDGELYFSNCGAARPLTQNGHKGICHVQAPTTQAPTTTKAPTTTAAPAPATTTVTTTTDGAP